MIPTRVPGIPEGPVTTCLLPTGSACEQARGISHLFEHIFIAKLYRDYDSAVVSGYTTEDYVILFCYGIGPGEITATLRGMTLTGEELRGHKRLLIAEIERESGKEEEAFFRFLWQGTAYEKSPLGTVADVSRITTGMLEDFRSKLSASPLFFYGRERGVEIVNGVGNPCSTSPLLSIDWRRDTLFAGRHYHICYVDRRIEAIHLVTRILKESNPDKHIQMSEKKMKSALILEAGTRFPEDCDIGVLRKKSLEKINHDISGIKANFAEKALNELESLYFYGRSWLERIGEMFKTTEPKLRHLLSVLHP